MEHILSLYARPYDALHPVVCFDEKPYQLLSDVQDALPAKPGMVKREDYEYRREATANLFVAFEPLTGQRVVEVTDQRCACDFADQMRKLAARYPNAVKIHVVLDNLSTHSPAASRHACVARRISRCHQRKLKRCWNGWSFTSRRSTDRG
jgi:hypothetical protein